MQFPTGALILLASVTCAFAADVNVQSLLIPPVYIEETLGQDATIPNREPAQYWIRGTRNHVRLRANLIEQDPDLGGAPGILEFGDGRATARHGDPLSFRVHSYSSNSSRRNLGAFQHLDYPNAYPGIDVRIEPSSETSNQIRIALRARIAATVSPSTYILRSNGRATIDQTSGEAAINFSFLTYRLPRPVAWQERGSFRVAVPAEFIPFDSNALGIRLGEYNRAEPVFVETSFTATAESPTLSNVRTDSSGNLYAVGSVFSPLVCARTPGGRAEYCPDAWAARFNANRELTYLVRFAGDAEDSSQDLALSPTGELLVLGNTSSADFPITAGALQPRNAGPIGPRPRLTLQPYGDLFLARLRASDGELLYSTYFGAESQGESGELAILPTAILVLVKDPSTALAATPGAWISQHPCAAQSLTCSALALARFNTTFNRLEQFTFLPTLNQARLFPLNGVDGAAVLLAGVAEAARASALPITPGVAQPNPQGGSEGYALRFDASLSQPVFATFIGTPGNDFIRDVIPGANPTAPIDLLLNASDANGNRFDEHVRLAPNGASFIARRRIGENGLVPTGLARHASNRLYVYGQALRNTLPTSANPAQALGCAARNSAAGFVVELSENANPALRTYLPDSTNSPLHLVSTAPDSFSLLDLLGGRYFTIHPDRAPTPRLSCVTGAASRFVSTVSPGQIVTLAGAGLGPQPRLGGALTVELTGDNRFPVSFAGVELRVNGVPAPLLYVESSQVNAIVPYEGIVPGQPAVFEITFEGRTLRYEALAAHSGVELFTLDFSGSGQAVALNQDGSLNSQSNPADPGSIVVLYGTGIGATNPPSVTGAIAPLSGPNALAQPIGPIVAQFSGRLAEVLYAGAAPGLVNGAAQFNLRVPTNVSGPQNIDIRINGALPNNLPTIWVR